MSENPKLEGHHMGLVAGRSCAGCTLCCKLLRVVELSKQRAVWCDHCGPKSGCKIYSERPNECRAFECGYLLEPDLGEEWRPLKSRMVVGIDKPTNCIAIHVDPARRDAWRQPFYYRHIKGWAGQVYPRRGNVIVWIGAEAIAVLPDRDLPLGEVGADDVVVTSERHGPVGVLYDVRVEQGGAGRP